LINFDKKCAVKRFVVILGTLLLHHLTISHNYLLDAVQQSSAALHKLYTSSLYASAQND